MKAYRQELLRLVDRVAEAGLVEREHCPSDRRSVWVVVTDQGRQKLAEAVAEHLEGLDRHLFGPLAPEDRTHLAAILSKLAGDAPACG